MKRSLSLPSLIKNSRFSSSTTFSRSSSLLQTRIEVQKINHSLNIVNSGLLQIQSQSQLQSRLTNKSFTASYTQSQIRSYTNTTPKNPSKMSTSQPQAPPSFKKGNTALITGGASGIGLSLAETCLKYGMNVIVVDNNGDELGKAQMYLSGLITGEGEGEQQVVGLNVDVGNLEEWDAVKETVEGEFDGKLHLLALNAGMSQRGTIGTPTSPAYFQKILSVNLFGVLNGLNTLLPFITSHSSPSSIIITGSKQGITNPPGNPAYNMSKSAVKTLAEHLSWDLREKKEKFVHLLIPGWAYTGLAGSGSAFVVKENGGETEVQRAGLENKPKGAWSGDQVVEYLLGKMNEDVFYVVCPDGEVTEEMDRKRIAWGAGDLVHGRQPLSRWREEYKGEFEEFMKRDL
ncbi:875a98d0-90f7-4023-b8a3-74a2878ec775-CDS [Sclerotinia trifoliorum]|uniref:875a98d0-90f7-4023-b8a3-74a2878ec775-CDS n=1 Tax=Sclerotinia trifoliorum TaxID=28548 RepID=A0A8H2W4D8_9HELO|nr:875a98d0-90f7-4023-b8a3-74a2878ec775-CDS [Sclerotinia trifoliorum]